MVVNDFHGVGRDDVTIGFVILARFVEVEGLAAQARRLAAFGRGIRFRRFLRLRFLLGLFFLHLESKVKIA